VVHCLDFKKTRASTNSSWDRYFRVTRSSAKVTYFYEMVRLHVFFFLFGAKKPFFDTHLLVFLINRYI